MALLRSRTCIIFYLLVFFGVLLPNTHADGTVSIASQPAVQRARPCVQNCLFCGEYWLLNCAGGANGAIGIVNIVSCNDLDSCVCRTDFESSISSYLTTCVNTQCNSNTNDLSTAVSLYNGYCGIDGATLDNYPATTAAVAGTTTLGATPGGTPTIIVYSTAVSSSSNLATNTSKWPLMIAGALVIVVASSADLWCA
jgi:hypothetical protein